jgi:type IV pilus assembly protein PilX
MTMQNKQQGIALVISLIMLLMMTLLGLSAMNTSLMEEKMAGNSRDVELAFQAAETALRDAEIWLADQVNEPAGTSSGINRVWSPDSLDPDTTNAISWWQEVNQVWWLAEAEAYGITINNIKTVPHSVIEYKQFIPDTLLIGEGSSSDKGMTYYQVTARGTGGSDQARVLLQSTTARRY